MKLSIFEQKIINTWEEVYKKGQLTLWILLALKKSPKHMQAIKNFIHRATHHTLQADDQSMYRALRRFTSLELITFRETPSLNHGPDVKKYSLTSTGQRILKSFVTRNITSIFYKPKIKKLLTK